MSARLVLSALSALLQSALALCAMGTRATESESEHLEERRRGSTWLRLAIASLAACTALLAFVRSTSASEASVRGALEEEALTLPACSVEPDHTSFWALSAGVDTAPLNAALVESASVEPAPSEAGGGCTGVLDDPLAPVPLCDPSATTGVAAAYVRSVADDRLEAGPGCGSDELGVQSWLGEREPDPTSWQQSSLEPAHLSELAAARAPAAAMSLPASPYPSHRADGISMNIERPPMRR
jgi:hypothetical protein